MITELNNVPELKEEIVSILKESKQLCEELRSKFKNIRVRVLAKDSPEVIKAIKQVFDESYITSSGDAFITYDMYCSLINLLRTVGNYKALEVI